MKKMSWYLKTCQHYVHGVSQATCLLKTSQYFPFGYKMSVWDQSAQAFFSFTGLVSFENVYLTIMVFLKYFQSAPL